MEVELLEFRQVCTGNFGHQIECKDEVPAIELLFNISEKQISQNATQTEEGRADFSAVGWVLALIGRLRLSLENESNPKSSLI